MSTSLAFDYLQMLSAFVCVYVCESDPLGPSFYQSMLPSLLLRYMKIWTSIVNLHLYILGSNKVHPFYICDYFIALYSFGVRVLIMGSNNNFERNTIFLKEYQCFPASTYIIATHLWLGSLRS